MKFVDRHVAKIPNRPQKLKVAKPGNKLTAGNQNHRFLCSLGVMDFDNFYAIEND